MAHDKRVFISFLFVLVLLVSSQVALADYEDDLHVVMKRENCRRDPDNPQCHNDKRSAASKQDGGMKFAVACSSAVIAVAALAL
uniref:Transmembrane protein n=1 Tax=Kalanchoe fedtschenkoi TaxID=63787 RepID=A0A7N0U9L7_KALFE